MVSVILESVNFVKNDILKCEYLEKCEFEHVNFWVKCGLLMGHECTALQKLGIYLLLN